MKHLLTLNARLICCFVFIFSLVIFQYPTVFAKGTNDAGISAIVSPASSVICAGSYDISVILKDYGNAHLTKSTINWSVGGVNQSAFSFTGDIKPDSTLEIKIGSYTFISGAIVLKVWAVSPNGNTDSFPLNDTSFISITINSVPAAIVGAPVKLCSGNSAVIGSTAVSGNTYSWISDPPGFSYTTANPTITPYATTWFILTETSAQGCTATDSVLITVNPTPGAFAGPDKKICKGESVTLGGPTTPGHGYVWASIPFGFNSTQVNPKVTPASSISYILTETDSATGCSSSHASVITVLSRPVGIQVSGPQNVCAGSTTGYGPAVTGTGLYFSFRVSDSSGTSGNSLIPGVDSTYIKWGTPGSITLWMIAENISGCQDSTKLIINISGAPVAGFTTSEVCQGQATVFSNKSTGYSKSVWHFDDGDTTSKTNPEYVFKRPGRHSATLVVINTAGCPDSFSKEIIVDSLPKAGFSAPKTNCKSSPVNFSNSSTGQATVFWDFGDSNISTAASPAHTYKNSGAYIIWLKVYNANGCADSISQAISILDITGAAFTVKQGMARNYDFKAADTSLTNYSWDFGDTSAAATGYSPTHEYNSNGTYLVRLRVTNSSGCESTKDSALKVIKNGIKDPYLPQFAIDIYPNPLTDQATLSYTLHSYESIKIILRDITGRETVEMLNEIQAPGIQHYTFSTLQYHIKPGIYFVEMNMSGMKLTRKISLTGKD